MIEGCGIGPEVVGAALRVLDSVAQTTGLTFELQHGGLVGERAEERYGQTLPGCTADFFKDVFTRGGAVLCGPGGGRFVYDLRQQFDLFCKFAPVRPCAELASVLRAVAENPSHVDMLFVRDNSGGVYQGQWLTRDTPDGAIAEHSFHYSETQVRRLATVAARASASRRGRMHVIIKDAGVPTISELWRDVAGAEARRLGVEAKFMNVDLAAYEVIRNPSQFDVVLTPNLFGDILVDITGILVGSRGATFSGNYDANGNAVYQTNHGCAHDLAGADVANPAGQILSLAMLLRESFGLDESAALIENALASAWRQGWRTVDVAEPGCKVVGTKAMAGHVCEQVAQLAAGSH
ncbi:MAG: 3-isopropylmalate dehydrogenase [Verrucomicrobia bacterium]|nr:3-isopropylmalate dehydrogenase [Verrucomicrobiota bacterium]